jgi:thiamine biosynthesis lipoprotein
MEKIEFRAMGSSMLAALEGEGTELQGALARVPRWFEQWEWHLSRFRPGSELNEFNRQAGSWVEVSPVMWQVLQAARRVEEASRGLVTPALQGVLEAYGYDRSFELVVTLDAGWNLRALQPQPLPRLQLELDPGRRQARLPAGTQLDFGGIAKGWAADEALKLLIEHGAALVDAGGDVATSPPKESGVAWPVGVTDPHSPADALEVLALQGEAVATSGRDVRHWQQGPATRHHIIDPRTGEPAANHVLAATAVAPTALEAEMAAKCILILGETEGMAWLDARPEYAGLIVLDDGSRIQSRTMESYLWSG